MRKFAYIILALTFYINVSAQTNSEYIDTCIRIQQILRSKFETHEHERDSLKSIVDKFSRRKFSFQMDESSVPEYLGSMTLASIYENRNMVMEELEHLENVDLVDDYKQIIEMIGHLEVVYNRETNDKDKTSLNEITVLDVHKKEFEALSLSIKEYRYVMYELSRIFRIIDKMSNVKDADVALETLRKNGDLDYIYANMPYVHKVLREYIDVRCSKIPTNFDNRKRELYASCPEVFPQFKSEGSKSPKDLK